MLTERDNMLVLGAKQGESIILIIGNETIEVKVTGLTITTAKLGFTCNDNVKIYREKIYNEIMKEKNNE